jgi:gliding motility-associated-like protein
LCRGFCKNGCISLHRTFLTNYDHIYTARGTDTIKLVVTADNGCIDTSQKTVHINRPMGSFTSDKTSGCLPEMSVNFTNTSTDTTIVRWVWNFGDNTADSTSSVNVTHLFSSDIQKTFYPSLTVYDAWSCSSSYAIPTQLTGIKSDFQADDNAICLGQEITFSPTDASLKDLSWDFGDGIISVTSGIHTYAKQGQFSVSMAATKGGCRDTITKLNYITVEKADANFTASDTVLNCYPKAITFIHNNSINSPAVDYLWTFGTQTLVDRSSSSVSYTFTRPGKYKAQLTARTLNSCVVTRSKIITVNGPDAAITFTPQKICYDQYVSFKLDSLKNVSQWKWLFGDGSTSTANPVRHKYTSRGKIVPSVQLISGTCTAIRILDTLSVSKVQSLFKSSDSTYSYCLGTKVNLLNNSKYSSSWNWTVDNVQTSTAFNLSNVQFSKTGDHYVRLIARETGGCADTLTKKFTINPVPAFSISGDSIICFGEKSVTLAVIKNTGDKIRWTPTAGLNDPTAFTVTARPAVSTIYSAIVTNASGCSSTRQKTIMVNQPFNLRRSPLSDTSIFIGQKIQLMVSTSESNVRYEWTPRDNISCISCNNPWVFPTKTTSYSVEATNSCFDITEKFIVEVISNFYLEAPSAFTPNGDSNNDVFKFETKNITNFELRIFNRWGEIVFSTNDISQGWDGDVNGHPQNADTYKYSVKAETIHGYSFIKSGEFLLLR